MTKPSKDNLFPKLSTADAKRVATERAAQATIAHEVALRNAKTARLRAARLEKEAADKEAVAATAKPAKRPKNSA